MRGTPYVFDGFVAGLNTIDSPYTITPQETRDCLNVVSTERGSIKKRYGSTKFTGATTPAVILNSVAAVTPVSATFLVATGSTKAYSVNTAGEVTDIGLEAFTDGLRWCIVQAPKGTRKTAGPVYMVNGKDKPQYWTGVEKATKTALWKGEEAEVNGKKAYKSSGGEYVPNGKYMVFAGERLWMAGMSDDPSAVRFCERSVAGAEGEIADPTWWPELNVVQFDKSDGDPITGLGVVGPYVLVFKRHKTWVINNLNTGENRRLSDTIGCVAHRSIVETQQGTFFLTADQGVYLTNGSSLREMSYQVRPTILAINPKQREYAAGAYINNHYYLSFCSGSSEIPNRTLDYDNTLKSWWLHDLAGNQWALWEPTAGAPFLYTIPPVSEKGVVKAFVPGTYTDSSANYAGNGVLGAWWLSAWEPFAYYIARHKAKAPYLKKRVRQIFFNGEGQIIPGVYRDFGVGERQERAVSGSEEIATAAKVPTDFTASIEKWGEGSGKWGEEVPGTEILWGGESSVGEARIYAPGVAKTWGIGWGNNSAEPFTVHSFTYMLSFRKS